MRKYIADKRGVLFDETKVVIKDKVWKSDYLFPWYSDSLVSSKVHKLDYQDLVKIRVIMSKYLEGSKIDIFEEYLAGNYNNLNGRDKVTLDYLL